MNEKTETKSGIVNRVARALFEQEWGGGMEWADADNPDQEYWRRVARAAMGAMIEPNEAMLEAESTWVQKVRTVVTKRGCIWRATMTAAMNEDGLNYDRTFDPITLKENSVAVSSS